MFDTAAEAQQKLVQTVVLYKGAPTLIQDASGKGSGVTLHHFLLRGNKSDKTCIWDEGWDFKSVGTRLGYSNVVMPGHKEAIYLTRVHVRKSHATQGLSKSNIRISSLRGNEKMGIPKSTPHWDNVFNTEAFWKTLEGKYPSIPTVMESFKTDQSVISMAFQSKLAIRKHPVGPYYLEYRGTDIAFTDDFYKWKIGEGYKHLRETLEHNNMRVA